MRTRLLYPILLALVFCTGQSLGEAVLGFIFTNVRIASDVNREGAVFFAVIRICLTLVPYVLVFLVTNFISQQVKPSLISLVLNLPILIYFYSSGMVQKDPASFIAGSILTSIVLLVIDDKVNIRNCLINKDSN